MHFYCHVVHSYFIYRQKCAFLWRILHFNTVFSFFTCMSNTYISHGRNKIHLIVVIVLAKCIWDRKRDWWLCIKVACINMKITGQGNKIHIIKKKFMAYKSFKFRDRPAYVVSFVVGLHVWIWTYKFAFRWESIRTIREIIFMRCFVVLVMRPTLKNKDLYCKWLNEL